MTTEIEYALLFANLVVYATILASFLKRERKLTNSVTFEQAYRLLDEALARSFADMKEGYTWQEAITKLKSAKPRITDVDWVDLENTTRRYEAFRYGGVDYGAADAGSVLRLAHSLQRRKKVAI